MQCFKYREDRLPVLLFSLYFLCDLVVFFTAERLWFLVAWVLIGIFPKGWICAWNHHHQHVATFKQVWLNRLLELQYGFQTGVTSHAWVLHHVVGHHVNYLDQTTDESRWKTDDGRTMGELEYSFVVGLTAYPRAYQVGKRYPKYRKVLVRMGLLTLALLGLAFAYNWVNALFVFLIPMVISLFGTAWATYVHHVGLESPSHFESSYNILNRLYNVCTGNLGYHTAHHYRQGVHWSKLPELHAEIAEKIPESCYIPVGAPFNWVGMK